MRIMVVALLLAACSSGNTDRADAPDESSPETVSADTESNAGDLVRNTYNAAHDVCAQDPDDVHKESGSGNVHDAGMPKAREKVLIARLPIVAARMR